MRLPGIHISIDTFKEIINKLDINISDKQIMDIFKMARGYSFDHRSVIINQNKKLTNQVVSRVKSSTRDANLLADIIYSVRTKMKHVGVFKIKQTDTQWTHIKELVPTINDFCNKYDLNKREGYICFVETGLKLLASTKRANFNFCVSWMLQKVDWILKVYDIENLIAKDKYPQETREVHDIYVNRILEMTGIPNNYINNSSDYFNFLKARELADKLGVDYETFIESQFEALAFCNGIPNISDLWGDKASQRLSQYVFKNGLTLTPESKKVTKDIWEDFKK